MRHTKGLRVVALFEAAKGALTLLAGFGLMSLVHHDMRQLAEGIVEYFQFDPASRYPQIFLQVAGNLSNQQLWLMAAYALVYAGIQLVEAYGLWNQRRWAEWLAVAGAGIFIPIEIHELLSGVSLIKVCALTINICIVVYMAYVLMQPHGSSSAPSPQS
jgi:uncharacterized membrane protein (DUF2068 family)